jgi:hypothetical protein
MKRLVESFDTFSSEEHGMTEPQMDGTKNYMFFDNIQTIHRLTGIMLEMDQDQIDSIIENGHDWAADHIATSKDDIEEVVNFFINEMEGAEVGVMEMEEIEEGYMCNECGSMYENHEIDEDLMCNECGAPLTIVKSGR